MKFINGFEVPKTMYVLLSGVFAAPIIALGKRKLSTAEAKASLKFSSGLCMVPHPDKAYKGGEDAACATERLLAVADGVGGWADQGVDPALYSKSLIQSVSRLFNANEERYLESPKSLVVDGASRVKERGSSTLVVATLAAEGTLRTANVGDSGYMILREMAAGKYDLVHKSVEQTHSFNFPFQLGTNGDSPNSAQTAEHRLRARDLVIVGSDGLFDNMSAEEVQTLVESKEKAEEDSPSSLAKSIAEEAQRLAHDSRRMSPFAKNAQKAGLRYMGGKVDDITVVVGRVE